MTDGAAARGENLPLVSVVIPAFNASRTIAATLESLFAQAYPAIETIVVDDGSSDRTGEVLKRFEPRIQVVSQSNQGLAAARKAGMERAAGAYIAWLDADDCCVADSVAHRVAVLEARPAIVAVSTGFSSFDAASDRPEVTLESYYANIGTRPDGLRGLYPEEGRVPFGGIAVEFRAGVLYPTILRGNVIHPPTLMFRRTLLERCGAPDPTLLQPDQDYLVRIARCGPCAVIPRPLLRYRLSDDQRSSLANQSRMHVAVVQGIERAVAADPALMETHSDLIRERLGTIYAEAAGRLADLDKRQALACLVKALRYRQVPSLADLTKLVLPVPAIAAARKLKSRLRQVRAA